MIKRFLSYVEIKTKVTSVFAFILGLAYLFSIHQPINIRRTVIFFLSMFIFDLTTTAINNYNDTKKNGQTLQFKRSTALAIILVLLISGAALGVYLVILTDLAVLVLGSICFLFGVAYSFGPIPISHQPWGELFSGLFYGFFIPLIMLYINMPAGTYMTYAITAKSLSLNFEILPLFTVLMLSAAPFCATANIMLANNTCDVDKDIKVGRYTLPYYLGIKKSLALFAGLYYAIYFCVIIMVLLKMLNPICLAVLITAVPVTKNIITFFRKQSKAETFIVSVQNYVIIMASFSLLVFVSGFLN